MLYLMIEIGLISLMYVVIAQKGEFVYNLSSDL